MIQVLNKMFDGYDVKIVESKMPEGEVYLFSFNPEEYCAVFWDRLGPP